MNKANLELIRSKFGRSFQLKHFTSSALNDKATFWHFHPEIELVYVHKGRGVRHVGNHLSYYDDGDLVLIGSNVPHNGFTDKDTGNDFEVVVQFREDFLGDSFFYTAEMSSVLSLFRRAQSGISFSGNTKSKVGEALQKLSTLSNFQSLVSLLSILQTLGTTNEYSPLNPSHYSFEVNSIANDRAGEVYQFIRDNYDKDVTLKEISKKANMTIPSFCRYFKKLTDKTFTQFLNEFRIIEACKYLSESSTAVTQICYLVGFNNVAHFNKHFKRVTGKSPLAYRKSLRKITS